jgi:hypothetical protein
METLLRLKAVVPDDHPLRLEALELQKKAFRELGEHLEATMSPESLEKITRKTEDPGDQSESLTAQVEAFQVVLHAQDGYSGYIGLNADSAKYNDDVRLRVKLDREAYCYLIAFNPDGKDQLCYPSDSKSEPAKVSKFEYPENSGLAFGLTDGVGLQAFALLVSNEPLPSYDQWRARAGAPKWKEKIPAGGAWRFDGKEIVPPIVTRGDVRPLSSGPPKELEDLCEFFSNQKDFDAVRAIAFPVKEKP